MVPFIETPVLSAEGSDPITALLTRDWAALGGWSLFIGLCMLIVVGSFREWWVPGASYRRTQEALAKASEAIGKLTDQNGQLITSNQITAHFFKETIPKRGEANDEDVQAT